MLNSVWTITSQMGEAARKTAQVQIIALSFTFLHIIIIVILIFFNQLGLHFILLSIIFEWLIAGILAFKLYKPDKTIRKQSFSSIIQMYKRFCLPLLPSNYFGYSL